MRLTRTWRSAYEQPFLIILGEPRPGLSSPPRGEPPTVSQRPTVPAYYVPGADADADAGDRTYLVLAKPNVIMNDIRLRGLAVAGSDAGGRKNPRNHAQTARNLKRSLRSATAGARVIQAEGLDRRSAVEVAASIADALEELHRLQRSLDRRIRRDQGRSEAPLLITRSTLVGPDVIELSSCPTCSG
jgi:hypothetical protein